VTDGSDAALATTLTRALSDAEARESRGAAARELARRFTWPLVASRLCQQYDTIVTARPVRVSGLTVVPR
jgi:glycosyltransferase involved in cell wall biosynthesis